LTECSQLTRHLWHRKIYALDAVGQIPEELWNLTALTNLYERKTKIMYSSLSHTKFTY
jgi:hypothetical protein